MTINNKLNRFKWETSDFKPYLRLLNFDFIHFQEVSSVAANKIASKTNY